MAEICNAAQGNGGSAPWRRSGGKGGRGERGEGGKEGEGRGGEEAECRNRNVPRGILDDGTDRLAI